MNEATNQESKFIMNQYMDVKVSQELVQLCSDCYEALGWTIINTRTGVDSVSMKLQRDRKIKNRTALCDLQRKCEVAFTDIERLEKSKSAKAMGVSLAAGLIGTAFMAGSVFAIVAPVPKVALCVILSIPGFALWALPYFIHKRLKTETACKVNPLIDQNYDTIYDACEKAAQLLA